MGKGSVKQPVVEYRMSFQFGICAGPVDSLNEIFISERAIGIPVMDSPSVVNIRKLDFFGGVKKEGGIEGAVHFMPGRENQVMTTFLSGKLGLSPETCPAFRGVATFFLTEPEDGVFNEPLEGLEDFAFGLASGLADELFTKQGYRNKDGANAVAGQTGFYMTANNPYLRNVWANVTRIPSSWYPERAEIGPDADLDNDAEFYYHAGVTSPSAKYIINAQSAFLKGKDGKTYHLDAESSSGVTLRDQDGNTIFRSITDIRDDYFPSISSWSLKPAGIHGVFVVPGSSVVVIVVAGAAGISSAHGGVYYSINESGQFEYLGFFAMRTGGLGVQFSPQDGSGVFGTVGFAKGLTFAGSNNDIAYTHPLVVSYYGEGRSTISVIPAINQIIASSLTFTGSSPWQNGVERSVSNYGYDSDMFRVTNAPGGSSNQCRGFVLPGATASKFFLMYNINDISAHLNNTETITDSFLKTHDSSYPDGLITELNVSVASEGSPGSTPFGWSSSVSAGSVSANSMFSGFPFEDEGENFDGSAGSISNNFYGAPSVHPIDPSDSNSDYLLFFPRFYLGQKGFFGIRVLRWNPSNEAASFVAFAKGQVYVSGTDVPSQYSNLTASIYWDRTTGKVSVLMRSGAIGESGLEVFDFGYLSLGDSDGSLPTRDANPAHIIYECLTNKDWGMGAPPTNLDLPSFKQAADTLWSENFGLSLMWSQQAKIESFIQEILDHIEAVLYLDPKSGLLVLKLIRFDYDPDAIPVLDETNCRLKKFQRKDLEETTNEIVVTWTNPENEQEETVTWQDTGNISQQGEIISENRNYYGVRRKSLAQTLASRDLRIASSPLASCDLEIDRSAWSFTPGSVFKLNHPEAPIQGLIFRLGNIDYGKPGQPEIQASAVEDVFSYAVGTFTEQEGSSFVDPSSDPTDMLAVDVFTLPYFLVGAMVDDIVLEEVQYPEAYAGILAAAPNTDTLEFELFGETTDIVGNPVDERLGTRKVSSRSTLQSALSAESTSTISDFGSYTPGTGPQIGHFILIGSANQDEDHEICVISSFSDPDYTVQRGVLDTVPKDWPVGTPAWFFSPTADIQDNVVRSDAEVVAYKALSITSKGILSEDDATEYSETLNDRIYRPLRPANVKVNANDGFSPADAAGVDFDVTWSNRNRVTEDAQILAWTDATVTPEAGQTTTLKFYDTDDVFLSEITGLSGTSHTVPYSTFAGETSMWVEVVSVRDGYESLQGHRILVVSDAGYGLRYGENYGGA